MTGLSSNTRHVTSRHVTLKCWNYFGPVQPQPGKWKNSVFVFKIEDEYRGDWSYDNVNRFNEVLRVQNKQFS